MTRREMLQKSSTGFGALALAGLLCEEAKALSPKNPLAQRAPHFPAKAKRIIFLFMHGGVSQVDTFDYRPALQRDTGKPYPGKKPRKAMPVKSTHFLIIRDRDGDIWLEKRPARGIWGGLWCFPEADSPASGSTRCMDLWGTEPTELEVGTLFRHTFSHYHLDITPVVLQMDIASHAVMEASGQLWYNVRQPAQIGLAAPVAALLAQLAA